MSKRNSVESHYTIGNLLQTIENAIPKLGKTLETVTNEEFSLIDELHVGGLEATIKLFDMIQFSKNDHIIDLGCGLGGPARYVAETFSSKVIGIDLTDEFISTGNQISKWLRVENQVDLQLGNALTLSQFNNHSFDAGYTIHAGMNIDDKYALYQEANRVLKPNANLVIYDIMLNENYQKQALSYPLPWADIIEENFIAPPSQYRQALLQNGFEIKQELDFSDFSIAFFDKLMNLIKSNETPALGLHILMKENAEAKINHIYQSIVNGLVSPRAIIAKKCGES